MNKIENYTSKVISEFNTEDTFYAQKLIRGYRYTFFLKFIKFEKGIITGKVCGKIQPNNFDGFHVGNEYIKFGSEMRFRISKCYTWSKRGCVWFEKHNNEFRCIEKRDY